MGLKAEIARLHKGVARAEAVCQSQPVSHRAWHALEAKEVLSLLGSREEGLSSEEARKRLLRDGPNQIEPADGLSWLSKLLRQFIEPLVVVLIASSLLSLALGDTVDALVIGIVVIINGIIGFVQEFRAERAIQSLGRLLVTEASVLRDGRPQRIPSASLVVGDIVFLSSGDGVPADIRLLESKELLVEEAALTGESVPVEKSPALLPQETALPERSNMVYAGSAVVHGRGHGVVVATGKESEAGRIARLMKETKGIETPLTRRIRRLSRALVWIVLVIAFVLFVIELLRGRPLDETFNAAVALAVAAIPEGLPAAVTVLLAVGTQAMARRNALIRQLPAVETLGSTTVICTDKTGTLTQNQMTVTSAVIGNEWVEIGGVGMDLKGDFLLRGAPIGHSPGLIEVLRAGALCNESRLELSAQGLRAEGDPTEIALIIAAHKGGVRKEELSQWKRLDIIPFESARMYMATLHEKEGDPSQSIAYVKGSSEALLHRCTDQILLDGTIHPIDHKKLEQSVEAMASQGMRVLVIARKMLGKTHRLDHEELHHLTLIGLVGMIDPPRPRAREAVIRCQEAGIMVKMITGDHASTAKAIAKALSIEGSRDSKGELEVLTGREIALLDEEVLAKRVLSTAVFARVLPEQKLSLVKALQKRGQIVAMTGDGVNDAPALKQADIGIAMGRQGTEVARAAAAMVLTDDDFATIAAAVEEGRAIYDNLVKFIAWTLPTNGGEAVVLLAAMLLGTELPVLPLHLLWINMSTALLLGTSLIFEVREPGLMQRPPRSPKESLIDRNLLIRTILVSLAMGITAFALFEAAQSHGEKIEAARTLAMNTVVVVEVGYLFACRSLRHTLFQIGFFTNPWVFGASFLMLITQLGITYLPFFNRILHTGPIEWWWWVVLSGLGFLVYLAAELKKVLWKGDLDVRGTLR
ncbi:MAG: HAD-IC family P-type ATPase [Sandaracinaceae bacterium]|nr:HAD-IC family P-type ATPase [Sandaracinaceae bacterium]